MPVYTAKDYEEVLARIQEKVAEKGIQMGECLSEDAIVAFEKSHNIRLPQGYRMFLQRVGNGCDCAEFPLNPLEGGEPRDLSHPFLLEEAWIWEDDDRDEDVIQEEIKTKVYQGEIELIDLGDCDCYHLIVTGNCRGEVWNISDVGAQPCCERQDFLGWFELWLDNQGETDFFKDYVYE